MHPNLRLPKSIASDSRAPQLVHILTNAGHPLWPAGTYKVAEAPLGDPLLGTLQAAYHAGRVVRSLEKAEQKLAAEARGQQMADRKSGVARGERISRLLFLSNDGAERFYRRVETVLQRHGSRVVAVRLSVDAEKLGTMFFGTGRVVRLLMVEHKDAVASILLTLADQWRDAGYGA